MEDFFKKFDRLNPEARLLLDNSVNKPTEEDIDRLLCLNGVPDENTKHRTSTTTGKLQ